MTDRRVKVTVDADYDPLIKGSGEAVVAVKAAREEVKGLGKQADETGRDMDKLAAETELAKKEVDGLGSKSTKTGNELAVLDRRIDSTKRKITQLGLEFAATGDVVAGKKFNDQRSLLAQLEKLKTDLEGRNQSSPLADVLAAIGGGKGTKPALDAGKSFGQLFGEGFSGGLKGPMIAGLVIAAAAIAPGVGAAVAGAVTGVVGGLGVAGGLFAASKDPGVRNAAADLGHHISQGFFASGGSFVDPIKQSVGILKTDFDQLDLKSTFALAAPYVTEFAHGIGGIATEFMPGFNQALVKGKPAIDLFASRLPEIGKDLGDMLSKMAGSKGTLEGVNALFNTISGTIHVVGTSVAWLGDRFHDFNHDADATFSFLSRVTGWLGDSSDSKALKETADDFKALSDGAQQGAIHFQTLGGEVAYGDAVLGKYGRTTAQVEADQQALNAEIRAGEDAIDGYINAALGARDATLAVSQDFLDLGQNLIKGKKNWGDNTQAGIDNQKMISQTIGDLERQRKQAIDTSDGSVAAIDRINKKYNDQMAALDALATKAGMTQAAFQAMAGVYQITIIETLRQQTVANKQGALDKAEKFLGFASGGETPAYAPFVVGEHGPELMWDSKSHYVATNAQAQAWSGGGGTGGGGGMVQHVIDLQLNGRTIRTLLISDGTARGVSKVDLAAVYP